MEETKKPKVNVDCVNAELEIIYRKWFRSGRWIYPEEEDEELKALMKKLRLAFREKYAELNDLISESQIKKETIDPTPYENHPWFEDWWLV